MLFIFLTLFSSCCLLIFGNILGLKRSLMVTLFLNFVSLCLATYQLLFILFSDSVILFSLNNWFELSFLSVKWGFYLDHLSAIMIVLVLFISFLVQVYSIEYMSHDPFLVKFMSYLSLFTFSMLFFVSSSNLVQMFLGWEAVGLCSYLLISFWNTRLKANKAALKAVFINRIGDCFFLAAIILIVINFGTADFDVLYLLLLSDSQFLASETSTGLDLYWFFNLLPLTFLSSINVFTIIAFFLFIAVCCKSAQFGFHTWLPDAMEGPTPVSALLHAATMVTAGIFLVLRCFIFFEQSEFVLTCLTVFGSITAFFSSTIGLVQNDLKKVIAYSTCSQLGYMLAICGLSFYNLSFFHLVNHAFFKALLFLSAGVVIHALRDEQDMRKMGGLFKAMPLTFVFFIVGSFSLIGLPFLSGFYSKDLILEYCYASFFFSIKSQFLAVLGTIAAFLTSLYSFKVIFLVFLTEPRMSKNLFLCIHEPTWFMMGPILVLSLFSILFGFFAKLVFADQGLDVFQDIFFFNNSFINCFIEQDLNFFVRLLPLLFTVLGFIVSVSIFYMFYFSFKAILKKKTLNFIFVFFFFKVFFFFSNKWYFDFVYNKIFLDFFLFFFYFGSTKSIDRGLLEVVGPFGLIRFFIELYKKKLNSHFFTKDLFLLGVLVSFFFFFELAFLFVSGICIYNFV